MNQQLAQGILETAQALQMDPQDLATIISYETAGTFSPTQRGPTTQWGQHRGLIQFGEPQAREYGVNWDDPLNSQLGANGAVANYFRRNGWQPGMGMLDAYSIVNAGGPGLHHRSDANNGGAPGSVADKVRDQMSGHRRNAERLLAGMVQPQPPQGQPQQSQRPPYAPQQPQNALAQMQQPQPPEYQNSLSVGDFVQQPQNALALQGFSQFMRPTA
jgi:hypothetical protein